MKYNEEIEDLRGMGHLLYALLKNNRYKDLFWDILDEFLTESAMEDLEETIRTWEEEVNER